MSMVGDLILETCNAPGQAAVISLAGAPAGRARFGSVFTNNQALYYIMHDGTNWETAPGTFGNGTPNTITRPATVSSNSAGTSQRINFPGTTYVYCQVPASYMITQDMFASQALPQGYQKLPGGMLLQWGTPPVSTSQGVVTATWPIAFPAHVFVAHVSPQTTSAQPTISTVGALTLTGGTFYTANGGGSALANINVDYFVLGN